MTQNIRSYTVTIGTQGAGIAFDSAREPVLQMAFTIEKTALSTPNKATISLYNLAPDTEQRIQDQYDQIVLLAGYGNQNSLLFSGTITSIARRWENCDYIVEIEAGDGDFDYHKATVSATLAAGSDHNSVVAAALASFAKTKAGPVNVGASSQRLRGKVVCGATRDVLDAMARDLNAHWSIQDGQLVVCGVDLALPTASIPLVSAQTGLEGYPTITEKGVTVRMRLMPSLQIGGLFRLETSKAATTTKKGTSRQDPSGQYKVTKIKHEGDYRGEAWSTEVECVRFA